MGHSGTLCFYGHRIIFPLLEFIPELKRSILGDKSDINVTKTFIDMDKKTLKNLLKENLKIDTETYSEDGASVMVIRILFDGEIITETYSYI